jgi:hypothetical protein
MIMEAYKFETTVLKNGIIQISEMPQFASRLVEIFIVVKQPDNSTFIYIREPEFLWAF